MVRGIFEFKSYFYVLLKENPSRHSCLSHHHNHEFVGKRICQGIKHSNIHVFGYKILSTNGELVVLFVKGRLSNP